MGNIVMAEGGIPIQQGIYEQSETKKAELGRLLPFLDGRCFRYCFCDGGISKGLVGAAAALNGNADKVTQTGMDDQAAGKREIEVLLSAAVTANIYQDSLLTIEADGSGDSEGYAYRVRLNNGGGASVAVPCKLTLYDPLVVALTSNSILSLTVNRFRDVIVAPADAASPTIGVPLITVSDNYYFWAQTRGYAAVLAVTTDSQPIIADNVAVGASGAVKAVGDVSQPVVGVCVYIPTFDEYCIIDLHLE